MTERTEVAVKYSGSFFASVLTRVRMERMRQSEKFFRKEIFFVVFSLFSPLCCRIPGRFWVYASLDVCKLLF